MAVSKIQTGLRIDEVTYNKLKTLSVKESRSINNLVEYIIHHYLDEYEKITVSFLRLLLNMSKSNINQHQNECVR